MKIKLFICIVFFAFFTFISCDLFFSDVSGYFSSALTQESKGAAATSEKDVVLVPSDTLELIFTLLDNNTYSVHNNTPSFQGEVSIPSLYEGLPVSRIADEGFKNNIFITDVFLPTSITTIGDSAFSGCSKLNNITMVKGIQEIQESAFSDCPSLLTIIIPSTVSILEENVFANNNNLSVYTELSSSTSLMWDEEWDKTISAVYTWDVWHKVSFDSNGGSPVHDMPVLQTSGYVIVNLPTTVLEGSSFAGWYFDEGYSSLFEENKSKVAADITVYAKWE